MSTNEITSKIEALKEWEALISEAQSQAESIRDEIKAEMTERNIEELEAGAYIIRWTSILSNRFDTTSSKRHTTTSTKSTPSRLQAAVSQ